MRRRIAGGLIRLAHKIYPPRMSVTNCNINVATAGPFGRAEVDRQLAEAALRFVKFDNR